MSVKRLRSLAQEAFNLFSECPEKLRSASFAGFVRACQILGIDVFPNIGYNGVIVRSSKFFVERFRNRDGLLTWHIYKR